MLERLKKGKLREQEETGMAEIKSTRGVSTGDKKEHIFLPDRRADWDRNEGDIVL